MTDASGIVLGLGLVAYLFLYSAFNLRESSVETNQTFAVFLALIGMAFTHILFYTVYLIAQNSAPYLTGGLLEAGLQVLVWVTALLALYLLFATIWSLIGWLGGMKQRRRERRDE